MDRLTERRLGDLLAEIASTAPAPGAGAAGAVALALGIACLRKAVRISARHRPDDTALTAADARLAALGEAALAGAAADARGFEALIAALRLPHEGAAEAAARAIALRAAAADLVAVAEDLLALGAAVRAVAAPLDDAIDPAMANDIGAALALVEASGRIHAANRDESRHRLD